MNSYAQNREDLIIAEYFGDFKGNLLSIGENDGRTFSNALAFIELGWYATLFEPGLTCINLLELHRGNEKVNIFNLGIGEKEEKVDFWESGAHVKNGKDKGLVSTTDFEETKRWTDVKFTKRSIDLIPYSFIEETFDYISIDAEGKDLSILMQIDLSHTKVLIIEWNSIIDLKKAYQEYCLPFGLRIIHENAENLIFAR